MTTNGSTDAERGHRSFESAFARVVCGIDGSRTDAECVSQAALLAGGAGSLTLVAVTWTVGAGLGEMAALGRPRAEQALDAARRLAHELGATASCRLIEGEHASEALLEQAAGHDLLVAGGHAGSRRAATLTAAIARAHGAGVILAHVDHDAPGDARRAMAEEAAMLVEATGSEPVLVAERGEPHERLAELAERHDASLLVVGSRGRSGARALGSVSARVAHRARCSVLVARPRA